VHSTAPKPSIEPSIKPSVSSPEDFLVELRPLYPGVDLDSELRKMKAWQLTPRGRGKYLTKQRMVNWLNKCDASIQGSRKEDSFQQPKKEGNLGWVDSNERKVLTPEEEERRSIEAIKRMMK
jgi:hypothetical protein